MTEINSFECNGKTYTLKEPLQLTINGNLAFNDELGIQVIIYSKMENQLLTFAKQQLADLWSAYAICSDDELSESELAFKRKLVEMVLNE